MLFAAAITTAVLAAPAAASCVMAQGTLAQRLADAKIVFVGTVASTREHRTVAIVNVESVWRGQVEEHVFVWGGDDLPSNITPVAREYRKGRRYLFVPYRAKLDSYRDNACTDTQPWTNDLEQLRPAKAEPVKGPPDTTPYRPPLGLHGVGGGGSSDTYTWVGGGALLAALALGAVFFLRRNPTVQPDV